MYNTPACYNKHTTFYENKPSKLHSTSSFQLTSEQARDKESVSQQMNRKHKMISRTQSNVQLQKKENIR